MSFWHLGCDTNPLHLKVCSNKLLNFCDLQLLSECIGIEIQKNIFRIFSYKSEVNMFMILLQIVFQDPTIDFKDYSIL